MANLRRMFSQGRMEQDTDERLMENGLYRSAENILVLESEGSDSGAVQNSLANRKLTNLNFGANPITLGSFSDETNKKLYWCVKSDTGCFVIEYDRVNNVSSFVLADTRPIATRVLNFKETHLITAISIVINADPLKNLMIINDDNLQPLCFNIERAKAYGVNGFEKEDIFLIKKPPRYAPKIQPTFIDGASNYIEEKFLSFSYGYKYLDGEYSAASSYSNYVFYPGTFRLDYDVLDNVGMLNTYNAVRITINTGDKRVTDVRVQVKFSNNNNLYVVESFNKLNEGWGDNEERSLIFSNEKIYITLPQSEQSRSYDNVPLRAKAQTFIGNLLVMSNYVEGYSLNDKFGNKYKSDFQLSIVSQSLEGSPLSSYTQEDVLTILINNTELKQGSSITIFVSLVNDQGTSQIYSQSFQFYLNQDYSDANELAQDADFIFFVNNYMTNLFLSSYTISPIPNSSLSVSTGFIIANYSPNEIKIKAPTLKFIINGDPLDTVDVLWEYRDNTAVSYYLSGNISSLKSNRSLEAGLIYLDDFGRKTTPLTQLKNTIYVDPSLSTSKNKLKININHKPPAFATHYKIVVKQQKLEYQTIYATIFYTEGLFRWIKLENNNYDKVMLGDILIIKSDTNGVIEDLTKVKVLEIGPKEKEFLIDNFEEDGTTEIKELAGNYMKIKLPAGVNMDYTKDAFKEFLGANKSSGDNFNMFIGPFEDEEDNEIPITQGSRIDILLTNTKGGSNGGNEEFEKTYFASIDYIDFQSFYENEVQNNTGSFSYPTNGMIRGNLSADYFGNISITENPSGKLYLRIHNELNGNGQNKSFLKGKVNIIASNGLIIFETEEKKSVENEIFFESQQTFDIVDGFHIGNLQDQTSTLAAEIDLDYFNCFCFGNGAESYVVKDAFNQESLNVDLRPSVALLEQYTQIHRMVDFIHSEPYIEGSNVNGINVFNTATGNYKELDKQYGSVQKLVSRENDIVVLKELKASVVPFQKDFIYNTDGSSNVAISDKIFGQERTYQGSNGIGKHPESYAENDYQIYYANPEQGVITRLSMDGTTPIVNGMQDFFRDILRTQPNAKMLGGYDAYTKQYTFSIGNEPERLLQLACENAIVKENQTGSFSYNLKLNDLSGDIVLNYNITNGFATIVARFNEVDHVVSNVTGIGNLTFERSSLIQNIVNVNISSVSSEISYQIGNTCPLGSSLTIASLILCDSEDIGKNTVTKLKWGNSSYYSNDNYFSAPPVNSLIFENGIEGVGKFPLNNTVFTIQSFKDNLTTGKLDLSKCNRLGFLISPVTYNESDYETILSLATFLTVAQISEIGYSETFYGSFLFNRSNSNEKLYLIWDYTDRLPVLNNDSASVELGGSVIVDVLINDQATPSTIVTIISGPLYGEATVNSDNSIYYTHDGSSNFEDEITYQASIGGCSATAKLYLSVGVDCSGEINASGNTGIYEAIINVGTAIGLTGITFNAQSIPDRFEIFYNDEKVADSKYVGDGLVKGPPVSYPNLLGLKSGFEIFNYNGSPTPPYFNNTGNIEPDFTVVQSNIANNSNEATSGQGTLLFNKTTATPTTIKVKVTGTSGTGWSLSGVCPISETDRIAGANKTVFGIFNEVNKLNDYRSIGLFLGSSPVKFYTNIRGDVNFNKYGWTLSSKFLNDGVTWWEIDATGNIIATGTI